jgi:hypothetical protein
MLDLVQKVELGLGNGITVFVSALPLRKMQELEPLVAKLFTSDNEDKDFDKVACSVDIIHSILTTSGNTLSKEIIDTILTTPMLEKIVNIAYGKKD